jgi:hypothetical protein
MVLAASASRPSACPLSAVRDLNICHFCRSVDLHCVEATLRVSDFVRDSCINLSKDCVDTTRKKLKQFKARPQLGDTLYVRICDSCSGKL